MSGRRLLITTTGFSDTLRVLVSPSLGEDLGLLDGTGAPVIGMTQRAALASETTSPHTVAVIPARGGSKGLARKNLRDLGGQPLIAHTIAHSINAASVDRTFVSTDDAGIAETSHRWGASVIDRPSKISGDNASTEAALEHALFALRETEGIEPKIVALLQCTSPFRQDTDIDTAIAMVASDRFDSVLSVVPSHRFIWKSENGCAVPLNYLPSERPRRQEMAREYLENGSIYIFRPRGLVATGSRLHGRIGLHVMTRWSSIEIDSIEDLRFCEWILEQPNTLAAPSMIQAEAT